MREGFALVDGRLVPLARARVPIVDRGFLLGDGAFETLRVRAGHAIHPERHLERLRRGLGAIGIADTAADEAAEAVGRLVEEGSRRIGSELYLRVHVTRTADAAEERLDAPGVVSGIVRAFVPYPERAYSEGLRVALSGHRKISTDPLATVKSLSYLPYLMVRRRARAEGWDDALVRNEHGRLIEASTSNLFVVRQGRLHSPGPKEGALDGVTRSVVLEEARSLGIPVDETVDPSTLGQADEVFLTNTVGGLLPVREVQGVDSVPAGPTGRVWRRLADAYEAHLAAFSAGPKP